MKIFVFDGEFFVDGFETFWLRVILFSEKFQKLYNFQHK